MSAYLANLVDRTLAEGPLIEPRPLSTYEQAFPPIAPVEISEEKISREKAATNRANLSDATPTQTQVSESQAASLKLAPDTSVPAGEFRPRQFTPRERIPALQNSQSILAKNGANFDGRARSAGPKTDPVVSDQAAEVGSRSVPTTVVKRDRLVTPAFVRPAQAILENAFSRSTLKTEAEPPATIKVTIGRVEVRANLSAPSRPPRGQSAAKSKLSLDDYLKARNGGVQ